MSNKNLVDVVVDSGASLPENTSTSLTSGFHIVPMEVTIFGKTYQDSVDLPNSAFYRLLKEFRALPTTSAPNPGSYIDTFRKAALRSHAIICLPVSTSLSSSYDSARIAITEFKHESPETKVVLLDTKSAAGSQGLIAFQAWRQPDEKKH